MLGIPSSVILIVLGVLFRENQQWFNGAGTIGWVCLIAGGISAAITLWFILLLILSDW